MATTSRPIEIFKLGLRDTSGAVVPSGKVRFFQPGTLISQTVFSDASCSSAYTQPITLNAYGQATIYTLEAVRCVAKDSTEITTYFDDVVNLNRADAVYMTVPGVNNGNETTVESAFANVVTGLGADFQYRWKANASATARPYTTAIGERRVSVKDFAATGDGTTDDTTAIQNAINSNAGEVYFPAGTYKVTAALTMVGNGSTKFVGEGRGTTIIKNFGTTTDVFNMTTDAGTMDYRLAIRDLTISANTSSSGKAINVPAGGTIGVVIDRVTVSGHATSIFAGGDQCEVRNCNVTYTGTGAANYGIYLGSQGIASNCKITGPGTGGSDVGCLIGGLSKADTITVGASKTGFSVGSSSGTQRATAVNCFASGCNVGYAIPASADVAAIVACNASSCTTDVSFGASCTNVSIIACPFTTYSGTALSYRDVSARGSVLAASSAASSATWTPDFTNGQVIQAFTGSYAAGAQAITVANPTNLGNLLDGTLVYMQFIKTGANQMNITMGAAYLDGDGSAWSGPNACASTTNYTLLFRKSGSTLILLLGGSSENI